MALGVSALRARRKLPLQSLEWTGRKGALEGLCPRPVPGSVKLGQPEPELGTNHSPSYKLVFAQRLIAFDPMV